MSDKPKFNFGIIAFFATAFLFLAIQLLMMVGMLYVLIEQKKLSFEIQEIMVGIRGGRGISEEESTPVEFLKEYSLKSTKTKLLSNIKLPENPTENDIREYIASIQKTTLNQRSFSPSDPQIRKLKEVGSANVHLLIESMDNASGGFGNFHVMNAIRMLADDSHKKMIIDNLPQYKELVRVVQNMGWEKDARDALLKGLKGHSGYLPTEWVETAAKLDDKEINPLLVRYFIHGSNRSWTYKSIKNLTGIELKDAVEQAWKNSQYGHGFHDRANMADIAVTYGHKDALGVLIETLEDSDEDNQWYKKKARRAFLQHTNSSGSNEEMIKWYRANRDKLVFDEKSKKFIISKK